MRRSLSIRRGTVQIQWIIIIVAITFGVVGTWSVVASVTDVQMGVVAEGVGDPTALTKQWGPKCEPCEP